ncbi:MAG: iron dependent repressor, metal binding and dimerization domain protein, partial [Methanoculleus horonobensis]|nr:iron dependent repressor, metal binding and dimerization domain protein [Methanoculleus horonobensis]
MLPSTIEDYLEAVLAITGNGRQSVTAQEIAAALQVPDAAADAVIASLIEEGYLERAAAAVRLTEKGRSVASRVARKHRVLQCFLT